MDNLLSDKQSGTHLKSYYIFKFSVHQTPRTTESKLLSWALKAHLISSNNCANVKSTIEEVKIFLTGHLLWALCLSCEVASFSVTNIPTVESKVSQFLLKTKLSEDQIKVEN